MQGKRREGGFCERMNEFGSRMNLIITLSSPKTSSFPIWCHMNRKCDTEHCTKDLLAAFCKACTRSPKKRLKSWRRDPSHMCRYHLNSIKTYGIKNILSRAEQQIRICSGFLGWGWVGCEWGMTDGFNNISLKLLEQSRSSEPRNYISRPQLLS